MGRLHPSWISLQRYRKVSDFLKAFHLKEKENVPVKPPCITRLTWHTSFTTALVIGCRHGSPVVGLQNTGSFMNFEVAVQLSF
ncbi:hypothetical protein XELAEV_18012291mg [Xenopus laevis]|uniref:Uncharacterized protein n=1 Tax=Xenopus laevis TaxID=8355 RepID=A0A974HY46_XENLA|nr:hypothetical protein XELAEV_18012291mg [Xenopus laevis]